MDERAELTDRSEPAGGEADRLEVLEQQVRQLTSRLAGWVEAQLVQALEDRRSDMKALRSELQVVVNEQLAGIRAESASVLSVATRRLEVAHEQLAERLDAVAERVASSSGTGTTDASLREEVDALRAELRALPGGPPRGGRNVPADDGLEQRVRSAMSRLSESVEAKLAEVTTTRRNELDEMGGRLEDVARQAATAAAAVHALRSEVDSRAAGMEALEQRARTAMGRLSDSVETRLADLEGTRQAELDELKHELQKAMARQLSEARADIGTSVSEAGRRSAGAADRLDETVASNGRRIEALELHTRRTDERLAELVEAKLGEVVAERVREARTEIGTVVADAHRRFLDSVERLDERMAEVAKQAQVAVATNEKLKDAPGRIDSLEEHTRRTDERLAELVDAKLSDLAAERLADLDEFRAQLRNALDAHLAETRADVAAAVGEGRHELAAGTERLHRLEVALAEAGERLTESVEGKLADLDGVAEHLLKTQDDLAERVHQAQNAMAERLLKAQAEMAAAVASAGETATEARDELQAGLKTLGAQVDAIAAATAKAAFAEEGALAPVRSDVRRLRDQVAELAQTMAEGRPRAKAPAAPTKAEERALALAAKRAALAKKAAPVRAPDVAAPVRAPDVAAPVRAPDVAAPAKAAKKTAKKAAEKAAKKAPRRRPAAQ